MMVVAHSSLHDPFPFLRLLLLCYPISIAPTPFKLHSLKNTLNNKHTLRLKYLDKFRNIVVKTQYLSNIFYFFVNISTIKLQFQGLI